MQIGTSEKLSLFSQRDFFLREFADRRDVFRISLLTLLLLVTLLPVGIGVVEACRGTAIYIENVLLDEPLREMHRTVATWMMDCDSVVCKTVFLCALLMISNAFGWALAALAIAFYAFFRWRIARIFAIVLLMSVPIVELLVAAPFSALNKGLYSLVIAQGISIGAAILLFVIVFLVICRFRPIPIESDKPMAKQQIICQKIIAAIVVMVTLGFSAFGWSVLRYSGIFE